MSTIAAGTTSTTALVSTGDTTGKLVLQTNGTTDAVTIDTSQRVIVGATSASAGGLLTLNRAPTAAFGSPILQIGGSSYTSGGYYSVGLGFTDATYTEPPAEIAYVPTSDSGGTKGAIVFGNRDVTTNTAVSERMRIDSSGNVGINNSSPAVLSTTTQVAVKANASADAMFVAQNSNGLTTAKFGFQFTGSVDNPVIGSYTNHPFLFLTNNSERMRIDSSGNLLVGKTTTSSATAGVTLGSLPNFIANTPSPSDGPYIQIGNIASSVASGYRYISFRVNAGGTEVGSISTNGSSTTSYNTSSDYRLKENVAPMTGALATVAQLKPVTYTWKVDGSAGQGFIAHELQAVVPDAVTGAKDAVDDDGNPKYQGVDTSFLVATLTAAIQELKAITDAQAARIETLEAKVAALEAK